MSAKEPLASYWLEGLFTKAHSHGNVEQTHIKRRKSLVNNWDKHLNHLNFFLFSSLTVSRKACHKDLLFFYFDHKRETV